MKRTLKKLAIFTIVTFIFGIIIAGYAFYSLSDNLMREVNEINLNNISAVESAISDAIVLGSITFFVGLISIILLLMSERRTRAYTSSGERIIYDDDNDDWGETKTENVKAKADTLEIQKILKNNTNAQAVFEKGLSHLCKTLEASQAAAYLSKKKGTINTIELFAGYAFHLPESETISYEYGEGLAGQVAKERKLVNIDNVPEGYIQILSGLGSATPKHLVISPIMDNDKLLGVVEIASFTPFSKADEKYLEENFNLLGSSLKAKKPVENKPETTVKKTQTKPKKQ